MDDESSLNLITEMLRVSRISADEAREFESKYRFAEISPNYFFLKNN